MTLKVRVNSDVGTARSPCDTASVELFADGRVPSVSIMRHLIEVFREHFGSQFPCLDLAQCMSDLETGNGSVFLLNCIAAVSARYVAALYLTTDLDSRPILQ